ncbi:hypothetical protein pb186bvf_006245 [Paramecium bursaria]
MDSDLQVIVRINQNSQQVLQIDQSVSINDILQEVNSSDKQDLYNHRNINVKVNGKQLNNFNLQIGQFKSPSSPIIIEIESSKQNKGKIISLIINIQNGSQINQSNFNVPENEQLMIIQERVYEIIGIYNEARKQLTVELFINQVYYSGGKLERTISDNNILNGTVIDAKLRWTGGKQ